MSEDADPDLLDRLRRAHAQLATIVNMVEERSGELQIAQQMQAVIRALVVAKTTLVRNRLERHLEVAVGASDARLREDIVNLKELTELL